MVLCRSLLLLIALLLPTIAFATTNYVVKKGDNLYDLSRKFGVSVEDIKTLNKLDNNNLGIGNQLLIPESNLQSNNKYAVKSGDTISQIAEKFGVKTKDLTNANKLKNDKLKIGQTLFIPNQSISADKAVVSTDKIVAPSLEEVRSTLSKNIQKAAPGIYTVKKGDTLGEIAEGNGVKTNDLKKANNLKSHNLQIGQKLVIPNSEVKAAGDNSKEVVSTKTEVKKTSQSISQNNTNSDLTVSNIYTVQKGDTVYDLSNKFKISKENFKLWNNLDNNNLKIGQDLFLTPNNETKAASTKSDKKFKPTYFGDYKVKKGDTLGHIASKHAISVKDLKSANDLTNNNLSIGKVLKVPGLTNQNKAAAKKDRAEPKKTTRHSTTKYIVKKGDTLGGISNRYGVSVGKVKEANSLKNNRINIGDVLLIPGNQGNPSSSKYTVVIGDTLGEIGSKFGVSVKELKDANKLTKNDIYVGMKLVVPGNPKISSTPRQTTQRPAQQKSTKYVVKRGDTLGLIAKRHGVSVISIKNANNMRGNNINAGQTISIPGSSKYRVEENKTSYSSNNKDTKESIISMAKQYLGSPYKFGGYSFKTGIDCSGYVKKIFSEFNVELPRTARGIYYNAGIRVAKSELQTGDLVFFRTYANYPSHVGIYMGNNQFIHASSGAHKVAITRLDKKYYTNRYIGAKRIEVAAVFEDEVSRK